MADPDTQPTTGRDDVSAGAPEPTYRGVTAPETVALAPVRDLWTSPVRATIAGVVVAALAAYVAFGSILARNVTFNIYGGGVDGNGDWGAYAAIRRFRRESVIDVWTTMWNRSPDFGSVDLTRWLIAGGAVVFLVGSIALLAVTFVPSTQAWQASLDPADGDARPGD